MDTQLINVTGERSRSGATAVVKPSSSRYYRPELDVVRLLAFMIVFFYHVLPSS